MSNFRTERVSIAGAPTIEFVFTDHLCAAELGGMKFAAVAIDEERANLAITDAAGEPLADIMVRKMPADESITVSVSNIGAALLWSHWRWLEAQPKEGA